MTCPTCKNEMICGCASCMKRRSDKNVTTYVTHENETVSCGHCGHTMHWADWTDLEMKEYKKGPWE